VRLQLIIAGMLVPSAARAQVASVDVRNGLYQDTDHTTINTTVVAAKASPTTDLKVDGHYLVDIITSASVDVISAATTAFHETRHEAAGGVSWHGLSAGYVYSVENDWESHTASADIQQDFNHRFTLSLGGRYVANAVGRAKDPNFHRSLDAYGGDVGLTFVLSPMDLLHLSYTAAYLDGYQASPYRFVTFDKQMLGAPETDPTTRLRHAVTLRWNHHGEGDTALRSHVRVYSDDWGIVSATVGTEWVIGMGAWETGLHVRGYAQNGADFYQASYMQPMRYMTADRELSPFIDGFAGARLGWHHGTASFLKEFRFEIKVDGFGFYFFDFPRLRERAGVIGELALGVSL